MSSNCYSVDCPVCNWDLDVLSSNRPYPRIDTRCRTCGFSSYTKIDRTGLDEINDNRDEWGFEEKITQKEYDKYNENDYFK